MPRVGGELDDHVEDSELERGSWVDIADGDDLDSPYTRNFPSIPVVPPTYLPNPMQPRSRAQTPSVPKDDSWSPKNDRHPPARAPSASPPVSLASPSSPPTASQSYQQSHSPLLRSVSGSESSLLTDSLSGRSFARPPRSTLPDPSQFPDPYPFRPPHHHMTSNLPALSSAGSSSASTRSSAYTSSGSALASGDYGHVHVASGDEEGAVGVGITSDDVVQLMASDSSSSSVTSPPRSRAPIDQSRWSESYSVSSRSRSSSVGQNNLSVSQDGIAQNLVHRPSFDIGWQPVDERDEVGMSEEETDDDAVTGEDEIDEEDEERDEERTSAIVIAEEGRGLIVQGEGLPVAQLQVQAGTTHLIVGSSSTPNAMPSFLSNILPQITHTLLALDISANFLGALPPCLAACQFLEELNIAFNPLRVLPVFLSELVSLRVLIADSTGIGTLPDPISELSKLHTLSLRRNKMHALPSWLCLLNSLQTLYVDGNPFQGPWKALVEPLLAKLPMTPIYPTSTPVHLLPSASIASSSPSGTEHETTDNEEYADSPNSSNIPPYVTSLEEEDQTVTPDKTQPISRPQSQSQSSSRGLARTRTTPNREFYSKARAKTIVESGTPNFSQPAIPPEPIGTQGSTREVRKMKSAGDLRRGQPGIIPDSPAISPPRPILPVSASSSNLLSQERPSFPKRFASVGPSVGQPPARRTLTRPNTSAGPQSIWDQTQVSEKDDHVNEIRPIRPIRPIHQPVSAESSPPRRYHDSRHSEYSKEPKEKSSKWGFLKKMSMGRIRPLESTTPQTSPGRSPRPRPTGVDRFSKTPQIDMRFSTLGSFDPIPVTSVTSAPNPFVSVSPPQLEKKPSMAALVSTSANQTPTATPPRNLTPSNNLLGLPAITPRATKRRSFLPLDVPVSLNIPEPSAFVQGVAVQNGDEPDEAQNSTPCPSPDTEQLIKREEERAREAYSRALRSVMAYLKDMNDLGLSQAPSPMSTYDDSNSSRARRPTIVERESTTAVGTNSQLRSRESMSALRSGTTSQTMSVATTDSTGSGEERKFKDDKGKRVMVVREIVETERTYVKGLRELFDIYIRPGSVPVNLITGVSSSKETVVPQAERKVVFGAVDSLFSFHKDNFLPALERATAPLMKPQSALQEADADGQLSLKVAREVGNVFLKHAAFLKMYSSYINNFDTAVTRVKQWTSDRHPTSAASPISSLSPSSSTAQLAGLGLAMSALAPSIAPDTNSSSLSVPNLTSSQRKRIRTYLKRCRMNPRHSQLNLEGYLLLPVQRIPRYRLLLEELLRSTPPTFEFVEDPLDRALAEILSLANNMNEGKRESESRRKLVQWQARIRGKFPSPLVQPHRRLIMDGPLLLTRVVRKAVVSFETFNAHGDSAIVQVDCLAPELTPRQLVGILCNDLLVLCRDPTEGQDPSCFVDLWAVLRMQTLPQPASIVHSNALRLVDNKAILYFDAPSPSDALNWFRAINLHIPASKA